MSMMIDLFHSLMIDSVQSVISAPCLMTDFKETAELEQCNAFKESTSVMPVLTRSGDSNLEIACSLKFFQIWTVEDQRSPDARPKLEEEFRI
jgi:hypothetical protein